MNVINFSVKLYKMIRNVKSRNTNKIKTQGNTVANAPLIFWTPTRTLNKRIATSIKI